MSGSNALQITDPNADNPLAQAPSWADAAQSVGGEVSGGVDALGQWLAAQRAKSSQMGLWNDQTGLPTGKGLVSAAQQTGNALVMGTTAPGIRAFHGSPYDFERFDTSKIGTGEGAQAYGHGLYFAEKEGTAQTYRDTLTGGPRFIDTPEGRVFENDDIGDLSPQQRAALLTAHSGGDTGRAVTRAQQYAEEENRINSALQTNANLWNEALPHLQNAPDKYQGTRWQNPGSMYEVNIGADPEQFLHWDKPLSEQSPQVQQALAKVHADDPEAWQRMVASNLKGSELYESGGIQPNSQAQALRDAGIPGIRYLDQGSRNAGGWHITPPDQTVSGKWMVKSNDYNSQGMHFDNEADARAALNQKIGGQTHNYVVFDAATIDILRKYGLAGLGIGLGTAAAGTQGQPQQ